MFELDVRSRKAIYEQLVDKVMLDALRIMIRTVVANS